MRVDYASRVDTTELRNHPVKKQTAKTSLYQSAIEFLPFVYFGYHPIVWGVTARPMPEKTFDI